jgi:GNAT superfamily N-acetyltransferase
MAHRETGAADPLRFRAIAPEELDSVLDLLESVSRWEEEIGLPHPWPRPFPRGRLGEAAARGEVYAIEDGIGAMVATVTLQWEDLPFWGPRPPDAGYVHRLAVRREHAGRSIGRRALAWAEERTREKGRPFLRLDCLVESTRLHRYYEAAGFTPAGEAVVGGLSCRLYEKRLGPAGVGAARATAVRP